VLLVLIVQFCNLDMRNYSFLTNNIATVFAQCTNILKEQGFEVLDTDKVHLSIEASIKEQNLRNRLFHLHFNHISSDQYQLNVEVRNMSLEFVKDRKNKRLELIFIRAFHRFIIEQSALKNLAQSA